MLKDEIKKKINKKDTKITQVNRWNSWPWSWDQDNLMEYKLKKIIKPNFQLTQYWRMKSEKKLT